MENRQNSSSLEQVLALISTDSLDRMLALISTKRLLEELERRARAQPGAWTQAQAARLLALAVHLNPTMSQSELDELGMAWWNNLTAEERAEWLNRANSVVPADAWALFTKSGGADT